jgi:hypothetical protein
VRWLHNGYTIVAKDGAQLMDSIFKLMNEVRRSASEPARSCM